MPFLPNRIALLAIAMLGLGLFAATVSVQAQDVLVAESFKKAANSELRLVRIFDGSFSKGLEPYQLTVRNRTAKAARVTVNFTFGNSYRDDLLFRSSFTVTADANSESVHQLLVPVPRVSGSGGYYYSDGEAKISASGIGTSSASIPFTRNRDWPVIAISSELAKRSLSELNEAYEKSAVGGASYGNTEFGLRFDPEQLPGDWRGYSGLDALMITFDEWRDSAAAAQQSMLEWSRLGGRLIFYTDSGENLKALGLAEGARSQGSIELMTWSGTELPPARTLEALEKTKVRGVRINDDYSSSWGVQSSFPLKSFNTALIIFLLIAFAITVGPLNLFVFAKAGKRHRLFVTTPLISIIASLLIAVLILLSDGLGGSGTRLLFVDLQPDPREKKAYLVQEQFSRSGVLLGNSFTVDEAAVLSPLRLKKSRWYKDQGGQLQLKGGTHSGDWFLSRSEQAQLIEAVKPTRSRVELREAGSDSGAPRLFSSVDFDLESLHYIDGKGKVWKATAASVKAGEVIELVAAERRALVNWWKDETGHFSESLREEVRDLLKERDVFFARSDDPKAGFVATLDAIRWKNDRAVIFGAVLPAAGASASAGAGAPAQAAEKPASAPSPSPSPSPAAKDNAKGKGNAKAQAGKGAASEPAEKSKGK